MFIDCSAVVVKKTASDMHSFYGDYLNIDYEYEGVTYSTSASYYGTVSSYQYQNIDSSAIIPSNNALSSYDIIVYQAGVQASNWMFSDVVIDGLYTRFDSYARGGFVGSVSGLGYGISVSDARNSVANWPNNYADNIGATLSAFSTDYYGYFSCTLNPGYDNFVSFRMIQYEFDNGGFIDEVHFDGLRSDNLGHIFIGVICPYVDGTISNTPANSNINVNVDINMTETNGILGAIRDLIANLGNIIVTGIKNLFIPTQEDLDAFKNTVEQLLRETFGGIPALEEQLEDAISGLFNVTAKTSIRFDGIQFDGHYYVPAQDVNLKPAGYDSLYTFVEMIINILATIAVVNTCINQVRRVIVGEVVIDAD